MMSWEPCAGLTVWDMSPALSWVTSMQNVHLREQNLAVIPNWCTFVVDTVVSPNGGRPSNRIADKGRSAPPCFEHVVHSEPAKQIDGVEARLIVEQVEADLIQQCMTQGTGGREDEATQEGNDIANDEASDDACGIAVEHGKIYFSKLNRNSKALRHAFCAGLSLQSCRSELESHGHNWKLLTGTLVFVHPMVYRDVMAQLNGMTLQPDEIIFSEAFEYLVEETMALVLLSGTEKRMWAKCSA